MNQEEFEKAFENRVRLCREVLVVKAREYAADGDRLHNFNVAAEFNSTTPQEACWWFLTKHLVSLSDMVTSGEQFSHLVWNEKLGDALNYLFLLDAIVKDERRPE
jgi:hypothetical protein